MRMDEDRESLLIDTLKHISKIIDNLKFECEGRVYTLNSDEMGLVFYCRDLADETLRKIKENE